MKRIELIQKVKDKIEYAAYKNSFGGIRISNGAVKDIIKYIENHYHNSLFNPQKKD
jgi:hypothetical protein